MQSTQPNTGAGSDGTSARSRLRPSFAGAIWAGVALLSAALIAVTLWITFQSGERVVEAAEIKTRNFAQLLDQHTVRTLDAIDVVLHAAANRAKAHRDGAGPERSTSLLGDLAAKLSFVRSVHVVEAGTGRLLFGVGGSGAAEEADRDALAAHAAPGSGAALRVGRPFRDADTGRWLFGVSRPVTGDEGALAVAVAHVDLDYFQRFFDGLDVGLEGSVVLYRDDGVLLARRPYEAFNVGRDLSGSKLFREQIARADAGTYQTASITDGVERIISYRRIEGAPMVIVVSVGRGEALAPWWVEARRDLGVAGACVLVFMGFGALAARQVRRRDRAEAELRRQTALVQATLDNMDQGLVMFDATDTVQVCNRRAMSLLDLPEDLMARKPTFAEVRDHQLARGEFNLSDLAFRHWVMTGGVDDRRSAYERVRPNGTVLEIRTVPLPDGGAVRTYTDITSRKAAETAMAEARTLAEEARAEAERVSQAKTEFLASMSHEIRTPLNGIMGFTDLLLSGDGLSPEKRRFAELIRSAGSALLTVVNDVLDFSKIEEGKIELLSAPFPVAALVDNSVSIMRGTAESRGLDLAVTIDPGLPAWLRGDEGRLRQILLNLLNNAVKFTREGGVRIEVLRESGPGGDEAVRFSVADTGIGIPLSRRDRLFERFSQVDGSVSREFGGTGLGLAICKRLVELMGGRIGLESEEGRGSTFWFTLPLQAADPRDAEALAPKASPPRAARRACILLVEDVEANQEIARAVLEAAGHRVDVASNGAEAVAAVQAKAYDLVLMDIQMPGMDGVTATERIRALAGPAAAVPIVAMTANVLPVQVSAFRRAGMQDHVGKPFQRAELYEAIDRNLRPAEPAGSPAFDQEAFGQLQDLLGEEKLRSMLDRLGEQVRAQIVELREGGDRADLARRAHGLVSQAGMLGFVELSRLCRDLENACLADREVVSSLARVRAASAETLGRIDTMLRRAG